MKLFLLVASVSAVAQLSLILSNPIINTASDLTISLQPTSPTTAVETTPSQCIESPYLSTSNYISRTPICQFSTNSNGDVVLTVSNLRTTGSSQPNTYGLLVSGLIIGPSAQSNYLNGVTSTGCYVQTYAGTVKVDKIYSNNFFLNYVYKTADVTLSGNPAQNGQVGTLTVIFKLGQPVPVAGSFTIAFPMQNANYANYGLFPTLSMVQNSQMTAKVSYTTTSSSASQSLGTITPTFDYTQSTNTYVYTLLGNTAQLATGTILTVVYSNVIMPPNLAPLSGFILYTGDTLLNIIEYADYPTLTNSLPGTDSTAFLPSTAEITANDLVSATDATYYFTIYTTNDVPMDGLITISVPASVSIPSSGLTLQCDNGCASTTTLTYSGNLITLTGAVPTLSSYVMNPGPFQFSISGFTNPADTDAAYFVWTSYAVFTTGTFMIDQISQMSIVATKAVCDIYSFYPTDGNTHIYGVASNWTATLSCSTAITSVMGLRVTLPSDFYVIKNSNCTVGLQSQGSTCIADSAAGSITIMSFTKKTIKLQTKFTITFNSIRNPAVTGQAYTITFESLSATGGVIGTGTYATSESLITVGYIKQFTVTPQSLGVGQFPVYYDFLIQPSGEIYKGAYLVITLPDNVVIYNSNLFQQHCAYNITGFTQSYYQCSVAGSTIIIYNGFTNYATTTMLAYDLMVPPVLKFTLPQFWNPRTTEVSQAFGLSIFSESMQEIYTWQTNYTATVNGEASTGVTTGPAVQITTPATPQSITFKAKSDQNSAVTDYNITIKTTNYLQANDELSITLPYPFRFTNQSKVFGLSSNLAINQIYKVSADLQTITTTIVLSRRRMLATQISAGSTIQLVLTAVQNAPSTSPATQSVIYSAYTGGQLFEQQSNGIIVQNARPGSFATVAVQPSSFRQSSQANYTLQITLGGFAQNMQIKIVVPVQLNLTTFSGCLGLFGTDTYNLSCSLTNRTITVTNAVTFQTTAPKSIKLQLNSIVNPSERIETESFKITTVTSDGYIIDSLDSNVTINFWCEYPCKTCNSQNSKECHSCYSEVNSLWFSYQCINECSAGYFAFGSNCTACKAPASTCTKEFALSCIPGYFLSDNKCIETVYWPFPFVFICLASLCLILVQDRCTQNDTRVKESYVAIVSLAEVGSWTCFLVFHFYRRGYFGAFFLGAIAAAVYLLLTWTHAVAHTCKIKKESEFQYKRNSINFPCTTAICRMISYLVSFKFSLIEISHLTRRQIAEYNQDNWYVFNNFALVFMLVPYPLMMLACGYFIFTDGILSYAGYCAIETIAVTTLIVCLLFLDAITVIKCCNLTKRKNYKVRDYESDLEPKVKQKEKLEFGESRTDLDGSQKSLLQPGPEIQIELSDCSQPLSGGYLLAEQPKRISKIKKDRSVGQQIVVDRKAIVLPAMPKQNAEIILRQCESNLLYINRIVADCGLVKFDVATDHFSVDLGKPIFDTIKHFVNLDDQQLPRQKPLQSEQSVLSKSDQEVCIQTLNLYRIINRSENTLTLQDLDFMSNQLNEEQLLQAYQQFQQTVAISHKNKKQLDSKSFEDFKEQYIVVLAQREEINDQVSQQQEFVQQEDALFEDCLQSLHQTQRFFNREQAMLEECSSVHQSSNVILAGVVTPYNEVIDQKRSASPQQYVQFSPSRGQTAQPQAYQTLDHFEFGSSKVGSEQHQNKCLTSELFFHNNESHSKDFSAMEAEQEIVNQPAITAIGGIEQIEALLQIDSVIPGTAILSDQHYEATDLIQYVNAGPAQHSVNDKSDTSEDQLFLNNHPEHNHIMLNQQEDVQSYGQTNALIEMLAYNKELSSSQTKITQLATPSKEKQPATVLSQHENAQTGTKQETSIPKNLQKDIKMSVKQPTLTHTVQQKQVDEVKSKRPDPIDTKQLVKQTTLDSPSVCLSQESQQALEYADESGQSESNEDVVHHGTVFNYEQPPKQNNRQVKFYDDEINKSESSEGVLHTQFSGIEQSMIVKQKSKQLALLYSDKSESSVDEMMHDTPSNYNVLNNRLAGKSMGLKQKTPIVSQSLQLPQRRNNEAEERKFVTSLHGPIRTIIEEGSRNQKQFTEFDTVKPKQVLRKNNYI